MATRLQTATGNAQLCDKLAFIDTAPREHLHARSPVVTTASGRFFRSTWLWPAPPKFLGSLLPSTLSPRSHCAEPN
jgi:hypothetical protein